MTTLVGNPVLDTLAEALRKAGAEMTTETLDAAAQALSLQRSAVRAVLTQEGLPEKEFLKALAASVGMEWFEPPTEAAQSFSKTFPARLALRYHLVPLQQSDEGLVLATYDPLDYLARAAVRQQFPGRVRFVASPRKFIVAAIRAHYGVGAETFEELLEGREEEGTEIDNLEEVNVVDGDDSEASVMKFVNQIIREALVERATDIHVEPLGTDLRIRYRIDGVLHEVPVPQNIKVLQASVLSRIKIMSNLDIAERRIPQDGRINLEFNNESIDVRVATIPSVTGETISLRLLGQEHFDFERLGLDAELEKAVRELLAQPNGIVLVTGPTGSGKSTSLYTFLSSLNTMQRRIVTIEDPVEHKLPGVIQIAVRPEISLTFATALRAVLRGDPNVIMVGEMRDLETAEIAVRAALTGHLVFSTLHTNDSVGGIIRLIDMGVEPFLIGSSVRAFIAQRLVRRLCPECKKPDSHAAGYLEQIGFPKEWAGATFGPGGCDACRGTGYRGRTALYEICLVTPELQDLIQVKAIPSVLRAKATEQGLVSVRGYGWKRVIEGVTSVAEVLRVTAADVAALDE
jgi:type II secretory ATPase GspE/PulE/Tfp pilus assembly ATPase PilB-like protein